MERPFCATKQVAAINSALKLNAAHAQAMALTQQAKEQLLVDPAELLRRSRAVAAAAAAAAAAGSTAYPHQSNIDDIIEHVVRGHFAASGEKVRPRFPLLLLSFSITSKSVR